MRYKNIYKVKRNKKDIGEKVYGSIRPKTYLPNIVPDYKNINDGFVHYAFLGHSSVYTKINNYNILIDPCFSKHLCLLGPKRHLNFSPTPNDFDSIDYILITHDHYDHLDLETILKFNLITRKFIVPLGIKKTLVNFGIDNKKIIELNWNEDYIENKLKISCSYAHHNSTRYLLDYNKTLWCSYVIDFDGYKIFHSGDTAFSEHFKDINDKFGGFDLAFIECGQYGEKWHDMHMFPEETIEAIKIINSKLSIPIHWGAYILSFNSWNEPVTRFKKLAIDNNINYLIPEIYKLY